MTSPLRPALARTSLLAVVLATTFGIAACSTSEAPRYEASIRRTSYGIPHIKARDYGSLGFGMGYAFAEDRACTLLDQVVKVRSERAKYLGPGENNEHLDTDFAYLHLGLMEASRAEFENRDERAQQMIRGYAAGFNKYVGMVGADGLHGHCKGAAWVGPIDEYDLFAYFLDLGLLAGSRQLLPSIGGAQPPGAGNVPGGGGLAGDSKGTLESLRVNPESFGSNGWGVGAQLSENGQGMVLANPHFPWEGELRLWESHITIPGELDVYGVGLSGVPAVLIGFNDAMSWTHTVSDGQRFNFYKMTLGSTPTRYMFDGEELEMDSTTYTIEVLRDGQVQDEQRTLYRSVHGPIVSVSPFGWDYTTVFALRDANIDNYVLVEQFLEMDRAKSMDEFQAAHRDIGGVPWVNTMSASADGRAWYMDSTPTPNVSDETLTVWETALADEEFFVTAIWQGAGVYLFDGSTSRDLWVDEPGARSPGLVPYDDMPKLERADFIFNANDSHWLTNPAELLEGFSPLHGLERTARSVRTRMNALELTETGAESIFGADGKLSIDELKTAAIINRGMVGELLRDQLVSRCEADPVQTVSYDGAVEEVDLTQACTVLANWDLRYNLDSVGAHVMREFNGDYPSTALTSGDLLFATPFDVTDPINTPRDLAPAQAGGDDSLEALARGVLRLQTAGVALNVALGTLQATVKNGQQIPIHGGMEREGVANKVDFGTFKSTLDEGLSRGEVIHSPSNLGTEGYVINNGTSFIMTMTFTPEGPDAWAFLTYSQSDDPESANFSDQTLLFSEKTWRRCLFLEADIAADPNLVSYEVSGD